MVSEPVKDLKNEVFSTRLEDEPREADKALARPLVSEPAKVSDPESDLNNELFSPKLETEPSEALRATVRALRRELE